MKNYVNAQQFKANVRQYAKENGISGNEIGRLWQEIMLDDLLERISLSSYRDNFVLKGGFLLSAIVGINKRSTEDIDAEIKGFDLTEAQISRIFNDICKINDGPLKITLKQVEQIHEAEDYKGYRLHFDASFQNIKYPLKVDISTGDKITPKEIKFEYKLHLENRKIKIWAYNIETIVAEKLETVITRSVANTRMKDFYDLYILKNEKVDSKILNEAFINTSKYRDTVYLNDDKIDYVFCNEQISLIEENTNMQRLWSIYAKKHPFSQGISFEQVVLACREWLKKLELNKTY